LIRVSSDSIVKQHEIDSSPQFATRTCQGETPARSGKSFQVMRRCGAPRSPVSAAKAPGGIPKVKVYADSSFIVHLCRGWVRRGSDYRTGDLRRLRLSDNGMWRPPH